MLNGRWSFAAWLPFAAASCAAAAYVFLAVDDGLPMAPGPGGGGEGILFLIVWFLRLLALMALAACFFLRPRGEAWNAKAVVTSTLLWGSIFAGAAVTSRWTSDVIVHVRAVDTTGRPLSGVRMDYRWSKRQPLMRFTEGSGTAVADAGGIATFRVPRFHTLYVYGDKKLRPTHEVSVYDQGGPTLLLLHSTDGASDRNTYRATPSKASELNASIEFDPPTDR
jgi:hypothetical protein